MNNEHPYRSPPENKYKDQRLPEPESDLYYRNEQEFLTDNTRYWKSNFPLVSFDLTPRLAGKKGSYEQLEAYIEVGGFSCEIPCHLQMTIRYVLDCMFIGLVALCNSKKSFNRIMNPKKLRKEDLKSLKENAFREWNK